MRSQCAVMGATLRGVEAIPVTVEVVICSGLPGISIVGMADTAVQEARERVRAAIRSAGFSMPNTKIIINLAPCSMKKNGSAFDLPIALGVLAASAQIDAKALKGKLFVGELSLEGSIRPVSGLLSYAKCAKSIGMDLVSDGKERLPVDVVRHLTLESLQKLHSAEPFHEVACGSFPLDMQDLDQDSDFKDIAGHEVAKRALQIAVAGKHGVLMMGPPGSGKTMMASRVPTIMPPLSREEMMEAAVVASVAGENADRLLKGIRPFRNPHHSATVAGMIGGGSPVRPGEVSLAHRGALFLDELPEFKTSVIQSLRQPMESGNVSITRADGNIVFPARFMLIAASNPCPCGYLGDEDHACNCAVSQIKRYQAKIGGPIMDRIDIQLDVRRVPPSDVLQRAQGTSSAKLRDGVMKAIKFRDWRQMRDGIGGTGIREHARLSSRQIIEACRLSSIAEGFILEMAESYALSGRALVNTLNVARTIADMDECEDVSDAHLAEALGFRIRGEMRES